MKTEMGWYITEDHEFMSSHEIFLAMYTKLKKTDHCDTHHYPPIEPEDLKMLYNGEHHEFNIDTPVGLFQNVWFHVVFFLCCHGKENAKEMMRETFNIGKDASGREYVYQAMGEGDKNHTATDKPDDTVGEGK